MDVWLDPAMSSYLSGPYIFFLEPVVHYCSSKDFVNKRCATGETTVYQMVTASEFVLFTALRKVDLHATQHETIFLCPNYELLSFFHSKLCLIYEVLSSAVLIGRCASPTPALQLSGRSSSILRRYFSFFQFMTPPRWALHWLCICPGSTGLSRLSVLCAQ